MFAALRDRAAQKKDLRLATDLQVKGARLVTQTRWAEAEQALRQAAELRAAQLGPEAAPTLETRSKLAVVLVRLHRHDEASAELRDLLLHCPTVLGEDHAITSEVQIALAGLLLTQGLPDEAEELAMAVLRRLPASDKLGLMAWDIKLRVRLAQGRHREAADEAQALQAQSALVFGENHVRTLKVGSDRVQNLVFLGEYELAERECRALIERHGGADLLWLAVMNALVMALNGRGHHDQAEAAARRALRRQAQVRQPSGDMRVSLTLGLSRSLHGNGRHQEALDAAAQAKGDLLRPPGGRAALAPPVATRTAQALLGLGRLDEAETESRRAVDLAQTHLTTTHHSTLEAATTLGSILAAQGRHTEAREHLTRCATTWRDHYGPDHPRTIAAEAELAALPQP
ncbi:tetratricopeptide repeat protein [Streptacidiphilus sp. PAMC 29251]